MTISAAGADQDAPHGQALDLEREDLRRDVLGLVGGRRRARTPPALPRPPTSTWALITTLPVAFARSARKRTAAARAWVGVRATSHAGTGSPWATSSDFASASWIFTRRQTSGAGPERAVRSIARPGARPECARQTERSRWAASPYSVSAATSAAPPPRGVMQLDLVERARRGDHDAFAVLAGAAISRLDAPPGSSCGTPTRPRTPSRRRSSVPGVTCPRCGPRSLRRLAPPAARPRLHR